MPDHIRMSSDHLLKHDGYSIRLRVPRWSFSLCTLLIYSFLPVGNAWIVLRGGNPITHGGDHMIKWGIPSVTQAWLGIATMRSDSEPGRLWDADLPFGSIADARMGRYVWTVSQKLQPGLYAAVLYEKAKDTQSPYVVIDTSNRVVLEGNGYKVETSAQTTSGPMPTTIATTSVSMPTATTTISSPSSTSSNTLASTVTKMAPFTPINSAKSTSTTNSDVGFEATPSTGSSGATSSTDQNSPPQATTASNAGGPKKPSAAVIAGAVLGAFIAVDIIVGVLLWRYLRQRKQQRLDMKKYSARGLRASSHEKEVVGWDQPRPNRYPGNAHGQVPGTYYQPQSPGFVSQTMLPIKSVGHIPYSQNRNQYNYH